MKHASARPLYHAFRVSRKEVDMTQVAETSRDVVRALVLSAECAQEALSGAALEDLPADTGKAVSEAREMLGNALASPELSALVEDAAIEAMRRLRECVPNIHELMEPEDLQALDHAARATSKGSPQN